MAKIIIMVGCPGSGKSTEAKKIWTANPEFKYLSSDALRAELGTGEDDQSVTPLVFSTLRRRLEHCLRRNESVIIDATNLSVKDRKIYVEIAKNFNVEIEAYVLVQPKSILLERTKKRGEGGGRNVPEHIIDRMLQKCVAPTMTEGFSKITKL